MLLNFLVPRYGFKRDHRRIWGARLACGAGRVVDPVAIAFKLPPASAGREQGVDEQSDAPSNSRDLASRGGADLRRFDLVRSGPTT